MLNLAIYTLFVLYFCVSHLVIPTRLGLKASSFFCHLLEILFRLSNVDLDLIWVCSTLTKPKLTLIATKIPKDIYNLHPTGELICE